ncbi:MAG: hypothetical protein AAF851_19065, partial [Myxococcota bacterium]
ATDSVPLTAPSFRPLRGLHSVAVLGARSRRSRAHPPSFVPQSSVLRPTLFPSLRLRFGLYAAFTPLPSWGPERPAFCLGGLMFFGA